MIRNQRSSKIRKVDAALSIIDLFDGEGFGMDFVIAELKGVHPPVINNESDRFYFVVEGTGEVAIDDKPDRIEVGDLVIIPKGAKHAISGDLKYIVVTAPPFDPKNEYSPQ